MGPGSPPGCRVSGSDAQGPAPCEGHTQPPALSGRTCQQAERFSQLPFVRGCLRPLCLYISNVQTLGFSHDLVNVAGVYFFRPELADHGLQAKPWPNARLCKDLLAHGRSHWFTGRHCCAVPRCVVCCCVVLWLRGFQLPAAGRAQCLHN